MSTHLSLVAGCGNEQVDDIVATFISRCERDLPGRISAYYLVGSQQEGCAVAGSDIDLLIVLRSPVDDADGAVFSHILKTTNEHSPFELGCSVRKDIELLLGVAAYEKAASLLYGADLIATAPLLPIETVAKRWTAGSLRIQRLLRGGNSELYPPFALPDPNDPLCGYHLGERRGKPSTKLLVNFIARVAGALLAIDKGRHAASKKESLTLYHELIGGRWADYGMTCYRLLNEEWQYALPSDTEKLEKLRTLLEVLPQFEDHFYEQAKAYLTALGS